MSQDLIVGMVSIGLFMAPLVLLLVIFNLIYLLKNGVSRVSGSGADLGRINFDIIKYTVFLLALPACVLVSTVIIAYSIDFAAVLGSILWTLFGLAAVLAWGCYRLVCLFSTKTELQTALGSETQA